MKNLACLYVILFFCASCQPNGNLEKTSVHNDVTSSRSVKAIKTAFENGELVSLSKINYHGAAPETVSLGPLFVRLRDIGALQPVRNDQGKYDSAAKLSWKNEDEKLRGFLGGLSQTDVATSCIKQYCALQMILKTQLLEDNSPEALEALKYYTYVLATEKNLSPAVYYYSFQKLKVLGKSEQLTKIATHSLKAIDETILQNKENTQKMQLALKDYPEAKKGAFYMDQVNASQELDAQYKYCAQSIKKML